MTKKAAFNLEQFLVCGAAISVHGNKIAAGWGQRTWHNQRPGEEQLCFYFPQFFLEAKASWFTHEYSEVFHVDEFAQIVSACDLEEKNYSSPHWKAIDWHFFDQAFFQLETLFTEGTLIKAVPFVSQKAAFNFTRIYFLRALQSLISLVEKNSQFLYGYWQENKRGILGATPERLFYLDSQKKTVYTEACAGTAHAEKSSFLERDAKCIDENEVVVKDITEKLERYGTVKVLPFQVKIFGSLAHIVTPIEIFIDSIFSFEEAVKLLHPTPALGAYPCSSGKIWLQSIEKVMPRRNFGAPVCCVGAQDDNALCLVAIRALEWDEDNIEIKAGCGVTKQSLLEKEKEEICLKLSAIKKAFVMET